MAPPFVCVTDFEEKAHQIIDKQALDYYRSGAGEQFSLNLNREAFKRLFSIQKKTSLHAQNIIFCF